MRFALGLTVHTGWAAALLAGGDARAPVVEGRRRLEVLGEEERFVFHRAAELDPGKARALIDRARSEALERAIVSVRELVGDRDVVGAAVIAKTTPMPEPLAAVLAAHPRLHVAENALYRDLFVEACERCDIATQSIAPSQLDVASARVTLAGKIVGRPWSRDQKLAAVAAWGLLSSRR